MTPKERVCRAIAHEESDICPYNLSFKGDVRDKLVEFTGSEDFDKDIVKHIHSVGPGYPETNERVDDNHYTDAYGVVWEETIPGEIGVLRDPILREPSLDGYRFPDPEIAGLFDKIDEELDRLSDGFCVWSLGFSLYERAWSLRGMEPFLTDMVERPVFAHRLLDHICEINLALIDRACEHEIDGIRFGDDWGAQRGLIMGPGLWRTFIKPRLTRMVHRVASHWKAPLLHSDGLIEEIIPDLIEIGLDVLNPAQPDVMDIYSLKKKYGRRIAFWGGVSVQQLLPRESPETVRREVRRLIQEVGREGGFIIAPTHTLGMDIPAENLLVLVEELTGQTVG